MSTYLTFPDVNSRQHPPRVALLSVRLDRGAGLQSGSFGQDQVGKLVDVDEVVVVAQSLTKKALNGNPVC